MSASGAVTYHVLSLKQPWAALLVRAAKTIEVRRWNTAYRGRLLIHAARVPDPRPEAWAHVVGPELQELARLEGGIIGVGTLAEVRAYRDLATFTADQALHRNDPAWFEPAGLYGFRFEALSPLPFRRVPGYVRIFTVDLEGLDLPPAVEPAPPPPSPPANGSVMGRLRRLMQALGGKPGTTAGDSRRSDP